MWDQLRALCKQVPLKDNNIFSIIYNNLQLFYQDRMLFYVLIIKALHIIAYLAPLLKSIKEMKLVIPLNSDLLPLNFEQLLLTNIEQRNLTQETQTLKILF